MVVILSKKIYNLERLSKTPMAAKKFSISMEENTYAEIAKVVEESDEYRNISHFLEVAAKRLLREKELARQASQSAAMH